MSPNELLEKYVENPNLRKHCYAVESSMKFYANLLDASNADKWALAGLLHDIDWEKYPEDHPLKVKEILPENGIDEPEIINAILAHYEEKTGVKPETLMEKCLLACDELTGLITAASLMRPNGISDLEPKSVMKKMKDKGFARGVDREIVKNAYADFASNLDFELSFDQHIGNVIEAMRNDERLGL